MMAHVTFEPLEAAYGDVQCPNCWIHAVTRLAYVLTIDDDVMVQQVARCDACGWEWKG